MSEMDCETFDASLLDALYGELDDASATAMDAHAAGCASCAGRLAKLKRTRDLVRPAIEAALPTALEERVMAAANAAMEAPKSNVVRLADRRQEAEESRATSGGAIVRFLAKPQLAIAASFLLVLGAAIVFKSAKQEASPAAEIAAGPAGAAARGGAPPTVAATIAAEEAEPSPVAPPAFAAAEGFAGPSEGAKASAGARARAHDPTFAAAKALYDAGRYAEALSKFEPLAAHDPEAALYVARCLAKTKGCDAAAARYDDVARRAAGTESASRAALEAARCYKDEGNLVAARSRYARLENDSFVAGEASAELAALEGKSSAVKAKASRPAATTTAPPAARPAPAKPASATGY